ncbi:MAG TPA: hypothetical protein VFU81_15430, partial [Thermomicrobiales bacterium]|nr:hypothetical protein [Thermomicrobiales bacterium]
RRRHRHRSVAAPDRYVRGQPESVRAKGYLAAPLQWAHAGDRVIMTHQPKPRIVVTTVDAKHRKKRLAGACYVCADAIPSRGSFTVCDGAQ